MRLARTSSLVRCLVVIVVCTAACDETTGPPEPGAIMAVVQAQGADIATDGYRISVDGGPPRVLDSLHRPITFTGLEARAYSVRLDGLAANCSVVGSNPLTVTVASGQTALAQFTVACVANVGTVRVTTATSGSAPGPEEYSVMVDGIQRGTVGPGATTAIAGVRAGPHAISLGDVGPHCAITTSHPANVNVVFSGVVDVTFNIQCTAPGSLTVSVATAGIDVDPDGYVIDVRSASASVVESRSIAPNGSVTVTALTPAADYHVSVRGVSANCVIGEPRSYLVGVVTGGTTTVAFEVSCEASRLLAIVRDEDIYVIKSNGTDVARLTTEAGFDGEPTWSSTGRIAFTSRRHGNDTELYVMNADGTNPVRMTTSAGEDDAPSWSPNGGRIVFRSARDASSEIYVVNADGTGLTRLTNNLVTDYQPAWSSSGKIAFVSDRDDPAGEIYVMDEDGSNVVRLTNNTAGESSPTWSPDGSMIAFLNDADCLIWLYDSCRNSLFVMNADGSNQRQLSTGDEITLQTLDPSWSSDGRAIAFAHQSCWDCGPPSVWSVDVNGSSPALIASNSGNPAWKP